MAPDVPGQGGPPTVSEATTRRRGPDSVVWQPTRLQPCLASRSCCPSGWAPPAPGGCWWVRTTSCGWCRSSTGSTARGGTTWCSGVSIRPAGVDMHWSRLADLPLAAVITLAEPWLGRPGAVNLAVLVVPPLLGGVFVALFLGPPCP